MPYLAWSNVLQDLVYLCPSAAPDPTGRTRSRVKAILSDPDGDNQAEVGRLMSGPVPIAFGAWLKQRRRAAGITREDLAERVACSAITLQKIESGARRPSRQMALRLAAIFHVPADEHEAFVTF